MLFTTINGFSPLGPPLGIGVEILLLVVSVAVAELGKMVFHGASAVVWVVNLESIWSFFQSLSDELQNRANILIRLERCLSVVSFIDFIRERGFCCGCWCYC